MDSPICDPKSQPKNWKNARDWAIAALSAARQVQVEAEKSDLNVGRVYTYFNSQLPFNPWLSNRQWLFYKYDLSILSLDGELAESGKRNLEKLRSAMKNIWAEGSDETPILKESKDNQKSEENEKKEDSAEVSPDANDAASDDGLVNSPPVTTSSVATSTDDIPLRKAGERMISTISVLTDIRSEVLGISSSVKQMAEQATSALEKIGNVVSAIKDTAGTIDASISKVRRQLSGRDKTLEQQYNDYLTERLAEDDGLGMVSFYLLAQDKIREYPFLMIDDSEEAILQNLFLYFETDIREDMVIDKVGTRRFLADRVHFLSGINNEAKRVKQLYKTILAMNTASVYRIMGVDLSILEEFIGELRNLPTAHPLEQTYYQLVMKRSASQPYN